MRCRKIKGGKIEIIGAELKFKFNEICAMTARYSDFFAMVSRGAKMCEDLL
jgi:hypothetical protein